ncbi:MAG: cell division protein ZapD [Gammaproteobacteria bacterium]|nr:cell division protein ZapD [Gammaproteobacteria bacterium]
MKETIIYDHPLNEVIRVCLRLEQLFQQIDHQLIDMSILGTRTLINLIINLLHILDRPDLKAKLAKELSILLTNVQRYSNIPDINIEKFNHLTQQLDELSRSLIDSSGKIGQRLRDMELLNNLRMHLASPGGGCSFDIPIFHYWLQQPIEERKKTIIHWLNDFNQIRTAVALVLELVRNNAKLEEKTAVHGFHQELLDPQSNLRMIRIYLKQDIHAYPEVSIGRHFFSVRFYSPHIEKRPVQYTGNLLFWVAYCNL